MEGIEREKISLNMAYYIVSTFGTILTSIYSKKSTEGDGGKGKYLKLNINRNK